MSRILLTGFVPFAGEKVNPSQRLLETISESSQLKKILLPVSYERSFALVREEILRGKFECVLMLGQAGGRSRVGLERFAVNCMDAEIPDEDGVLVHDQKISATEPAALQAAFPLRKWMEAAKARNLPLEVSNSAGTYVCNYLSFRVAEEFSKRKVQSLFVHLPYLPEQLPGKPANTPSLTFEEMQSCVKLVMELMLD